MSVYNVMAAQTRSQCMSARRTSEQVNNSVRRRLMAARISDKKEFKIEKCTKNALNLVWKYIKFNNFHRKYVSIALPMLRDCFVPKCTVSYYPALFPLGILKTFFALVCKIWFILVTMTPIIRSKITQIVNPRLWIKNQWVEMRLLEQSFWKRDENHKIH